MGSNREIWGKFGVKMGGLGAPYGGTAVPIGVRGGSRSHGGLRGGVRSGGGHRVKGGYGGKLGRNKGKLG